ncbi:MAG: DUF4879 domain-containing protein [Luteibacter jiangsuensis]
MYRALLASATLLFALSPASTQAHNFGRGVAPGISQISVMAVQSETVAFEDTEHTSMTKFHHGGSHMYVVTVERGMGQATATMNGANLRELKTVGVCDRGGGYWVGCRNGQTIEGRLRVWDATGKGNGVFVVSSTSNNWPRNTMSSSLSIR